MSQKYIHPLERWQKVHNMFICKDPGVYKINRLRVVHIIDAELNLVRRELITRRLLSNAEMHGMIPKKISEEGMGKPRMMQSCSNISH